MDLIPIKETLEENRIFADDPDCQENISMTVDYFKTVGYVPPWIGYYAKVEGRLVGSGGFKGRPRSGKVEIAYGTFERFRQQGFGSEICSQLVKIALKTDSLVQIIARTLPATNYSTKILQKNGFKLLGTVTDKDDGEVWEWEFMKP